MRIQWPYAPWAHDLLRWSRHQGKHPPFGMERGFYDLRHGGPVDRALPVLIRRISDVGDQAHTTANQVEEMRSILELTTVHTQDLQTDYYPMDRLIEDLTTARAEVREYQERHADLEERVQIAERHLAEL